MLRLTVVGGIFLALGCNGCNSTPDPEPPAAPAPTTEPSSSAPAPEAGECVTGGCSGELCMEPGTQPSQPSFTNCEYKREYECYKTATCGRDAQGQCNWEMTPELDKCLGRK